MDLKYQEKNRLKRFWRFGEKKVSIKIVTPEQCEKILKTKQEFFKNIMEKMKCQS